MIEESSPATVIAPRSPAIDAEEPLIVIADDSVDQREAMEELFDSVGIQTLTFANARDLLDSPLPDRPGCFILDVRMPGPSGLDLQAQLVDKGHLMPIIFVTGHGDVPMSIRAIKAGAFDFKTKPVRDQDLLDAATAAIEEDRTRRAIDRVAQESLAKFSSLSARERQVLELILGGLLNKQIAYELGVTEATIKLHRGNVMKKMGVGSIAELARMWDHVPPSLRQGDAV